MRGVAFQFIIRNHLSPARSCVIYGDRAGYTSASPVSTASGAVKPAARIRTKLDCREALIILWRVQTSLHCYGAVAQNRRRNSAGRRGLPQHLYIIGIYSLKNTVPSIPQLLKGTENNSRYRVRCELYRIVFNYADATKKSAYRGFDLIGV